MRLIKGYIENFGKLKNFNIDFSKSTLLEKNGFGKTTLANFIKSMFFGFDSDNIKTRKDENNDRKKYFPWQGGAFGGNIVFEINGIEYKLERFFGESKTKDTFVLYNQKTNTLSQDFSSEIGFEIFGLDGDSFERCLYIPQKNIEIANTETISAKLNSIVENTDFGVGFDTAKNSLTKVRQAYFVKGGGGLINDTTKKLVVAQNMVEEIKQNSKIVEYKTKEIEIKSEELENLKLQMQANMQEISSMGDGANQKSILDMYNTLNEEFKGIEKQRDFVNEFFKNGKPESSKLSEIEQKSTDLEIKNKEFENLNNNLSKIEETKPVKVDKTKAYILILPCVLCLIIGAILTISIQTIGWIVCSVGFVGLLAVFIYVLSIFMKSNSKNKISAIEFNNLTKNLQTIIDEIESLKTEISEFYLQFDLKEGSFSDKLFTVKTMIRKSFEIEELYNTKQNQLESYKQDNKKIISKKPEDIDVDNKNYERLKEQNSKLFESISTCEKDIAATNSEILILEESVKNLDYYQNQVETLTEQLNQYKFRLGCVEKTIEFLESAKSNLDTRYLPDIKKAFMENCSLIKGFTEDKISISENLEVLVEENGQNRKLFYYSEGYKNILMLCLRLAIVSVLYKKEKPFIVLDDPFVNLDSEMFDIAKGIINKIGEQYQIIYFTCHQSRKI